MKLELKHILPYLGSELQVFDALNQKVKIIGFKDETYFIENGSRYAYGDIQECKPILRPLSYLINNILDDGNDENYNLNCELAELLNTTDCSHFVKALIENKYYAIDVRLLNDVEEFLNKNHFDWKFGLIEKGLAIDFNETFTQK